MLLIFDNEACELRRKSRIRSALGVSEPYSIGYPGRQAYLASTTLAGIGAACWRFRGRIESLDTVGTIVLFSENRTFGI
jgi:hypothetical protein